MTQQTSTSVRGLYPKVKQKLLIPIELIKSGKMFALSLFCDMWIWISSLFFKSYSCYITPHYNEFTDCSCFLIILNAYGLIMVAVWAALNIEKTLNISPGQLGASFLIAFLLALAPFFIFTAGFNRFAL